MSLQLQIFGISAATPAYGRHQSAQYMQVGKYHILIDCGDGTQYQLLRHKVSIQKIDYILISHLHGDHYLGLMGLLFTMSLNQRSKYLHIFAPFGLKDIIEAQLNVANSTLNFEFEVHEINTFESQVLVEKDALMIRNFPLDHRIPCMGFRVDEVYSKRKLKKEKLPMNLSPDQLKALTKGEDIQDTSGQLIKNESLTYPLEKSKSYAYCSDTCYSEAILDAIQGVDLLYHEATFLQEHAERAAQTKHSTAHDAAKIATLAKANKLIIGHFSSRYKELGSFLIEAQEYFENCELAEEGKVYLLD